MTADGKLITGAGKAHDSGLGGFLCAFRWFFLFFYESDSFFFDFWTIFLLFFFFSFVKLLRKRFVHFYFWPF